MYLVLFLNQRNYEFITSLHSSLPSAEAAYKALLLRFGIKELEGGGLCDHWGEEPHIYRIECDGNLGEEISVSAQCDEDAKQWGEVITDIVNLDQGQAANEPQGSAS